MNKKEMLLRRRMLLLQGSNLNNKELINATTYFVYNNGDSVNVTDDNAFGNPTIGKSYRIRFDYSFTPSQAQWTRYFKICCGRWASYTEVLNLSGYEPNVTLTGSVDTNVSCVNTENATRFLYFVFQNTQASVTLTNIKITEI